MTDAAKLLVAGVIFGILFFGPVFAVITMFDACNQTNPMAEVVPKSNAPVLIGKAFNGWTEVVRVSDPERNVECYLATGRTGSGVAIWCHEVGAEAMP